MKNVVYFLLFIIILFGCALSLEYYYENYIGDFEELQELKDSLGNVQVIYFGDSVVKSSQSDGIENILYELSGEKIKVIAHEAYHLGVYEAFVNYIAKQPTEKRPKIIIIPINMRSFSPEWDTRPLYQFNNEITKLNSNGNLFIGLWARINNLFGNSAEKRSVNESEWKKQFVYNGSEAVGTVRDFEYIITGNELDINNLIKGKFIYQYMYNLYPEHKKVISLKNIIKTANESGISVIIYITPIDYEEGETYVDGFSDKLRENTDVIKNMAKENNYNLFDFSTSLRHTNFNYEFTPNEHLKKEGTLYISEQLSKIIKLNDGN